MRYVLLLVMLCLSVEATPPNLLRELGARRRAMGGEPWTPAELGTNLVAWFDGKDNSTMFSDVEKATISTNGGAVRVWENKASGGADVSSTATPTKQNEGVYFSGTARLDGDVPLSQDATMLIVFDTLAGATTRILLDGQTSTYALYHRGSTGKLNMQTGSSAWIESQTTTPVGTKGIVAGAFNSSSSVLYSNGSQSAAGNAGDGTSTDIRLGLSSGLIASLTGHIYEIVYIDYRLQADRQKVEGYLAHKWGLTANLPAEHPYKNKAPRKGE